ncbi:MAG TPA: CheF family chemotaxis protein [Methanoregula sp.]|nr:CheF family chemotaxis protein [Methanoregula sp.]
MKEVPVKIEHDGKWIVIKAGVAEDRISFPAPVDKEILFKSVFDLVEKKNILIISVKGNPDAIIRIASIEKVLVILKRLILGSCNAYRLMAYFMSPAIRGGVFVKDAQWEKGSIVVVKTGIWFLSATKQISVPLSEVAAIELTKRDVQGKQTDVVRIDHIESGDVVSSLVLCPLSTLQVLFNFLKDATKGMDMQGNELDAVTQQVAMLVYSGMDSHAIENMLNIPHKQLDDIYDKIIKLGIAEVITIRREVQLTTKGVRYISDATKTQTN